MIRREKQRVGSIVFLFFGALAAAAPLPPSVASAFSARPLIRPVGEAASDQFGYSVSEAGDVNGDGYADVIVGAYANDTGGGGAGRAYVYYGGPGADALADMTLTGETAGDQLGNSVSGAGDVNGDGYADVIVGARFNDAGGSSAGRAYVYYGGPGADVLADLTLTGEAEDDWFGYSVSGAGDVNGDGYADVIVGTYLNDAGGSNAGRAYVYYGGPGADEVADLTLTATVVDDFFGYSVSGAGDVNGDGYADVIVGAIGDDTGGSSAGRAYVFYGGPGADLAADLTLTGATADDFFGNSVSGAGDVNGDGYADVIVGASENDAGGLSAGRAYVYYGGPGADALADVTLTGNTMNGQFGNSVSGAGDVNGDGYADVIVGAHGTSAGRAYVYYGGPGADPAADLTLTGAAAGDLFGYSVSGAGDVNGDGYADVIVGAYFNDTGGSGAGRAYVYTSRPYEVLSPNGGEQWVGGTSQRVRWLGADLADLWLSFDGGASYSLHASEVGGGDENEFMVTAPTIETNGGKVRLTVAGEPVIHASSDESDGVFRIVLAAPPPAAASIVRIAPIGLANSDALGSAVSSAGDMNGDGYDDVIVGAPNNDAAGAEAGAAYVFLGGPGADDVADLVVLGESAADAFGSAVSSAGDLNGDGFSDVIVGAPDNDAGGAAAGRAYVYLGGSSLDAVADLTLTGAVANEHYGRSVACAGDLNVDGYDDIIVGAYGFLGNQGHAFVYYGGPALESSPDWAVDGALGDQLGYSVSSAGDMNGDGYGDVIVGARGNSTNGTNAGAAYVVFGAPPGTVFLEMRTLTGAAPFDFFGDSVSGAGDVNGDGYSDVVVGADGSNATGTDAGSAYVYYGGPEFDPTADLTFHGQAAGDFFGISVASAGDANGDRFADVVVGAFQSDADGLSAGRAYLFYGGYAPDMSADMVFQGESGFLGISVASAGDVNADGFSDVILGARGFTGMGGFGQGRAYVHDMRRYHLIAPNGGETWNVGATKTISWLGSELADVWLSVDGGNTRQLVEAGVGGSPTNALAFRVPHTPSKFARIQVTPAGAALGGSDRSDSLFTIQTSVSLLALLAAQLPQGGASLTWATEPGPEDLAGYRLERAVGAGDWRTLVTLTRETSATDPSGGPGVRYRLFAVNGFGEELWLGEASMRLLKPLSAWPLPYRGGPLHISFATSGGLGGGRSKADVAIYDVSGRLVRRIASGEYAAGHQMATWDGRNGRGGKVATGIYFLRSSSGGEVRTFRLSVLR